MPIDGIIQSSLASPPWGGRGRCISGILLGLAQVLLLIMELLYDSLILLLALL